MPVAIPVRPVAPSHLAVRSRTRGAGKRPTSSARTSRASVRPSIVDPAAADSFTMDQELEPFGRWVGDPLWVPPQDASRALADTMLEKTGLWTPWSRRWATVSKIHRDQFTQVREFELPKASIRLPQGRLFVSVTEQKDFYTITDDVPDCVQTRLDEFCAGPGRQPGVRVYYLKPLCIEVDDQLIFTTRQDIDDSIRQIQDEVLAMYRKRMWTGAPKRAAVAVGKTIAAAPGKLVSAAVARKRRTIDAYHAKLEFQRRKTALRAARTHRKFRTDGCTFDEMLALTNPLETTDVIQQYSAERELSKAQQAQLLHIAAGTLPWFVLATVVSSALLSTVTAVAASTVSASPAVALCDPAFVAEMPGSRGAVLKIGHFDDVAGVRHIEL